MSHANLEARSVAHAAKALLLNTPADNLEQRAFAEDMQAFAQAVLDVPGASARVTMLITFSDFRHLASFWGPVAPDEPMMMVIG